MLAQGLSACDSVTCCRNHKHSSAVCCEKYVKPQSAVHTSLLGRVEVRIDVMMSAPHPHHTPTKLLKGLPHGLHDRSRNIWRALGCVSFGLFGQAQAYVAFYRKIEALRLTVSLHAVTRIVVSGIWASSFSV